MPRMAILARDSELPGNERECNGECTTCGPECRSNEAMKQIFSQDDRHGLLMAVEQAAESVIITDPDGSIRYVNPAFTRHWLLPRRGDREKPADTEVRETRRFVLPEPVGSP